MHIQIDIYPNTFSEDPNQFIINMDNLNNRIANHIYDACINTQQYAVGTSALLNGVGQIIATVDIRKEK